MAQLLVDARARLVECVVWCAPGRRGPFKGFIAEVETIDRWDRRAFYPDTMTDGRIEYFPVEFRDLNNDSE